MNITTPTTGAPGATSKDMQDHLERLRGHLIKHRSLEASENAALSSITYAEPGCMSVIVGPTGVGKTTLLRGLEAKLKKAFANGNKGAAPVVTVEFKANEETAFNWKDFYFRVLSEINRSVVDEFFLRPGSTAVPSHRATVDTLRRVTESSLQERKTRVILVDEAHHIAMGVFSRDLQEQLEKLKSFANMTKVHLVLTGPYQMLKPLRASGQLARRSTLIHFPRYEVEEDDLVEFASVVADLVENMKPWEFDFPIDEATRYFYERSLGLVGVLKPWFMRALEKCAVDNSWVVTRDTLDETAKGPRELLAIAKEMTRGEQDLAGTQDDWKELRGHLHLGFDAFSKLKRPDSKEEPPHEPKNRPAEEPPNNDVPPRRKTKRRPGERNPKRDKSGSSTDINGEPKPD
jgi:nucleoside-triphosphatase THEP1